MSTSSAAPKLAAAPSAVDEELKARAKMLINLMDMDGTYGGWRELYVADIDPTTGCKPTHSCSMSPKMAPNECMICNGTLRSNRHVHKRWCSGTNASLSSWNA